MSAPTLFEMSARYLIDPAATTEQLLDDLVLMLPPAVEAVTADHDFERPQWAGVYLLQQCVNIVAALRERLPATWEAMARPTPAPPEDGERAAQPEQHTAADHEAPAAFYEIANLASSALELEPMLDAGTGTVPVLAVLRQIGILADHQRARLGGVQARGDAMAWLWNVQEGASHG